MKKSSDLIHAMSEFLEKNLTSSQREVYSKIVKTILNTSDLGPLISPLQGEIPASKLGYSDFSPKDLNHFVETLQMMKKAISHIFNLEKNIYFTAPKITYDFNSGESILKLNSTFGMLQVQRALELVKKGYTGEKIRIGFNDIQGLFLIEEPTKRYKAYGKRKEIITEILESGRRIDIATYNAPKKKLLQKEIGQINTLFMKNLSLKEKLIIQTGHGYTFNTEVFKVIRK